MKELLNTYHFWVIRRILKIWKDLRRLCVVYKPTPLRFFCMFYSGVYEKGLLSVHSLFYRFLCTESTERTLFRKLAVSNGGTQLRELPKTASATALFGKVYRTIFQSKRRRLVFKVSLCTFKMKNYSKIFLNIYIFIYLYFFIN